MRTVDAKQLSKPYPVASNGARPPLSAVLAVEARPIVALGNAILGDMAPDAPYGVGWWAPFLGTSRRILIGDHLFMCVGTVQENLIEAAVHRLELLHALESESQLFANALTVKDRELVVSKGPSLTPLEDVRQMLCDLHLLGIVRALGGALDCLAAAIIGVLAVELPLKRAQFPGLIRSFRDPKSLAKIAPHAAQKRVAAAVVSIVEKAGPTGWLDWLLDYRNMLVHRGRRMTISMLVPAEGGATTKAVVVRQLPRDPELSDIEILSQVPKPAVLSEIAATTVHGCHTSTLEVVNAVGVELLDFWQWRRSQPTEIQQPTGQWKEGLSMASTGFSGYKPGSFNGKPSSGSAAPSLLRRLKSAALDDQARPNWVKFD